MIHISKNECVGCGICANICPEGIEMAGGKARIKNENAECLKDAANACPRGAMLLDEEESNDENTNADFNQDYGRSRRMGQGRGMGAGRGRGLGIGPRDGRGKGRGGGGQGRDGR